MGRKIGRPTWEVIIELGGGRAGPDLGVGVGGRAGPCERGEGDEGEGDEEEAAGIQPDGRLWEALSCGV